jgi:hypothetical protein
VLRAQGAWLVSGTTVVQPKKLEQGLWRAIREVEAPLIPSGARVAEADLIYFPFRSINLI